MTDASQFIARYHQVVDDLDRNGRSDGETMWLLGSLAARLVTKSNASNWTHLKILIDDKSLEEVVETLETSAAGYEAEGKVKAAYVARLLGISLVASRIHDEKLNRRDQMLNTFIDTAAIVFIKNKSAQAAPKG